MASRGTVGTFQTSDGYGKFAFTTSGTGSDLTLQKGNTIYAFNSNISESVQNLISNVSYTNSAIPYAYPGSIPLGLGLTPPIPNPAANFGAPDSPSNFYTLTYTNPSYNPLAATVYDTNWPTLGGNVNPLYAPGSALAYPGNWPNFGIPNPLYDGGAAISYPGNWPTFGIILANGQKSNVFTPCMAVNYWKNNQEFEVYNGIQNSGSATPVSNTTVFPFFSDSKCITAMMYSRMKTLGIIPTIKRVDEIFPNMKGVRWSTTTLSTAASSAALDITGSNTQTQYLLANDVLALPSSNLGSTATVPATYSLITPFPRGGGVPDLYNSPLTGLSNGYIHFFDFDATYQALIKASNLASVNTTYIYSNNFNSYTLTYSPKTNGDLVSNVNDGLTSGYSGLSALGVTVPAGKMAAILGSIINCGFPPVIQSFKQDNTYGSVPGLAIWNKLSQSNTTVTTTSSTICFNGEGYGLNIAGVNSLFITPGISAINQGFFTSNAFIPVITTQYAAKVSNVNVNGSSYARYGGILDGPFSVHPGAIPPGVAYTPGYTPLISINVTGTTIPVANVAPPVKVPGVSNVVYSPLTSNLYINTSDAMRPLYLDDVFSESVGFACGFEQFYFGNGTYGGVWGGSNNTYTSNVLYNPVVETLKTYGLNVVSELARSSVCLASNTAPINHVLDGTSNVSFCTSNLTVLPQFLVSQNAVATFNNFVNNFQGRTYVQTLPHGIFNYNSSGFIGTACMELLYNQYYGTSNTYYEILKKELLDPAGSNLVYLSNSSDMSTVWAVDPSASNPLLANQYYVPSSSPSNPEVGLDYTSPTSFARLKTVQFNNAPSANRLYFGNYGLCGTLKDLSKVLRIFARKGLDQNGNVIISEIELMNSIVPRNSLADYVGAQNYFPNTLALLYASVGSTYGLGGCAVGPSYSDYTTVEPSLQMQSLPQGREIRNLVITSPLNVSWVIPVPFAVPAFLWSGLGGSSHSIGINEQFVTTSATMESQSEFAGMIQSALAKYVGNDIVNPKSNCLVYTSSSIPVPYIPEPASGGK
jgi:hypothetical protein